MKINKPIIATIDIETYPAEVLMYGQTYEPVIVKINRFQSILSMAYKIGDGKTKYIALNKIKGYKAGDLNDKKLMIEIYNILKDVDSIVGQNSDEFDIKIIKERLMFHNLSPLPDNITTYDTKKLYKKVSRLPNNKLDTISQFNGIGQKVKHTGTDLFIDCGKGDEKAWRVNEIYNKKDVDLCYENLKKVLPYVSLQAKQTVFSEDVQCSNPLCLSHNLIKSKCRRVTGGYKIQYQCKNCHKYTQGKTLFKDEKE
jgi:DNA polymerase elongation subunit (family B)